MCYGVTWSSRDDHSPLSEPLCRALVSLPKQIGDLQGHLLHPNLSDRVVEGVAKECSLYFFHRVLLTNLFHLPGARKFARDLETITEALSDIFPVTLMEKCRQAAQLLCLPERAADGKASAVAIEACLAEGEFDRLTGLLDPLGIDELTFEEIGLILTLRR